MLTLHRRLHSLLVIVGAYAALALLMVTAPQNALGFWPGLLAGVIAVTLWRDLRTPPTAQQTQRRLRIAGTALAVCFVLMLIPQRDVMPGAPLGLLVAVVGGLMLDRRSN